MNTATTAVPKFEEDVGLWKATGYMYIFKKLRTAK